MDEPKFDTLLAEFDYKMYGGTNYRLKWLDDNAMRIREALAAAQERMADMQEASDNTAHALIVARERVSKLQTAYDRLTEHMAGRNEAAAALLALGCKLGPEGWMRPCHGCQEYFRRFGFNPAYCGVCNSSGYLPIPLAPSPAKKEVQLCARCGWDHMPADHAENAAPAPSGASPSMPKCKNCNQSDGKCFLLKKDGYDACCSSCDHAAPAPDGKGG